MKPIDWPRVFASPPTDPAHLTRLNERISHWPALCELCVITGQPLEAFDLRLTAKVRDFLLIVKAGKWQLAEEMYSEIIEMRITLGAQEPRYLPEVKQKARI